MIKLRTELSKILKEIHSRVYYEKAPSTAIFPYLVYDLPQSYFEDDLEVFNLDIDIWDNNTDTTEIETLAQSIWNGLDRLHHIGKNMQFSIYRQNRLTVGDDDPRIRRRTLIFSLRYYDRSVK